MTPIAPVGSVLVVPTAVDSQHARIARAPSIANAVEELQNLNRALAPDTDGIAITSRLHGFVFMRETFQQPRQFAYAVAMVVQIPHDLVYAALYHAFA